MKPKWLESIGTQGFCEQAKVVGSQQVTVTVSSDLHHRI